MICSSIRGALDISSVNQPYTTMSDPTAAPVNQITTPCATSDGFRTDLLGEWLARLIASVDNGVLIVDSAQRIVLINAEATRMFGYRPAELLNHPIGSLLPEQMRAAYVRDLARFAATRVAGRRLRIKLDLQGLRSGGEEFYVGTSLSRLIVNHETYLSIIVRELTVAQSPHATLLGAPRLAGSSQQANEIEKRQFSRALYDNVGQCLSVLKLDLDWCERQFATGAIVPRLSHMQELLNDIIAQTKNIASSLRPPLLDDFGLVAATEWLTDRFRKRTGIHCCFFGWDNKLSIDEVIESAMYRIIQEGLANIEQHAHAHNVAIHLWRSEKQVHVLVEDDGIGLRESWDEKPAALGLRAMQERIAILGGSMVLQSAAPSGLAILASLPFNPNPQSLSAS